VWFSTITKETGMSDDQISAVVNKNTHALRTSGAKRKREITIVSDVEVQNSFKCARAAFERQRSTSAATGAAAEQRDLGQLFLRAVIS